MGRSRIRRIRSIHDLRSDPQNGNRGTSRGRAALDQSLKAHGAGRSILVDKDGVAIAGNKTLEAAKAHDLPIQLVPTDGKTLVVVQRTDLDLGDPAARALAIKDNRIAQIDLDWDPQVLAHLRADGLSLDGLWTEAEWQALARLTLETDPREDHVLAPGPTTIQRGEVWAAGPHRIACGDATDAADVVRLLGPACPVLMATDPPYGVAYKPDWRHRAYPTQRTAVGRVLNDDQAAWPAAYRLFPGDVLYSWHASSMTVPVAMAIDESGFVRKAQIIWAKSHFVLSRGCYHYGHEPCWFAVRRGASTHWCGDRCQSTVWTVQNLNPMGGTRDGANTPTGHGTQKPVRLFEIPILNHTRAGEAVYDPFMGSGTTLIAAHKLGRVAYVMDLAPEYVQVTLDRWAAFSGERPTRIEPAPSRRRR